MPLLSVLYVLAKVWAEVFWKDASTDQSIVDSFKPLTTLNKTLFVLPICILAFTTLYIGLNAEMIIKVADRISNEMLDKTPYIQAVLGNKN
jgi:multicomponent Na+:H+ antiporter subunit D